MDAISTPHRMTAKGGRMGERKSATATDIKTQRRQSVTAHHKDGLSRWLVLSANLENAVG